MKLGVLSLLASATASIAIASNGSRTDSLTVKTSSGVFTGFIDPEAPNTRQWRSIPFAEPPVGSRRWLPPAKLQPSEKHSYSTKFPPSCPQFVSSLENLWSLPLTKGNLIYNGAQNDTSGLIGEATSEDCLYLAVWAPTTPPPKDGFPVLFFMTGGGFVMGGIELPWQIPTSWVERSQSAIIVTINYRVGIFGFPRARGVADGEQNLGILDQRAALEWVRDNAAAFGGDPSRIMHWGRSAGSISADIHAYAYHDDPIAQSYYMESGVVFSGIAEDPTYSNFSFVAQHVGCESPRGVRVSDDDGSAELDCMRRVSPAQIVNFIGQYGDRGETPALTFAPLPDDRIVFRDYEAQASAGKLARRPSLISLTANEFAGLVPWPKDNLTEGPWQPPVTELNVAWVCGARSATAARNGLGTAEAPVFRFQYAAEFPNLNVYEWLGAYHNSETPLVFGTYGLLDHIAPTTEFQDEVSRAMQDHIMAFAEDPYHGPQEKFGWRPQVVSEANGGDILRLGGGGKVVQRVDGVDIEGVCAGLGDTAAIYFENGTFVEVSRVEGSPAYKSFMRRRVDGQPPLDGFHAISAMYFSSTRDLVQSLQSTVTSYLGTNFCFASVVLPVKSWEYQKDVIKKAVTANGLRLTHRVLDASILAVMANDIDSSDDPDIDSQAVLSVDYSGSALNLVLFAEDLGVVDDIRRNYAPNLGAEHRGEHGHLEAVRAAVTAIAEGPFGKDLMNNKITDDIRHVVLHGDAVTDPAFLDALRAVVGPALMEKAHALSPVFASAVGAARVSHERMADFDFDQFEQAAFGCRWRSRLYGSNRDEL
ncbi:chlorogenic acid esterase precursor [Colletotrichum plurivorum]|uniref:Chlorogenic acid esterase n=1 Tax=Colletotrichum plurivorum TaxID=2175906 RepID=A0A8H6KKE1_9PEZI|nr:chlorogenic acid esterase precursor [Colletotrichum plurivorum]